MMAGLPNQDFLAPAIPGMAIILVLRLRNQVNIEAIEAPGSQGTPKRSVPKRYVSEA
jgi:hypothetical protein